VHAAERAGDRFQRLDDRRMLRRLRLKVRESGLNAGQRGLCVRNELRASRALDLVQRAHGLRDGCSEFEQMRRHVGIRLQRVEASRERLSRGSRERNGIGHGLALLLIRIEP
jgi:hypothetical protein